MIRAWIFQWMIHMHNLWIRKKTSQLPQKVCVVFLLSLLNWDFFSLNTIECLFSLLVVSKRTRYYPSRNASPTKYSRRESPSNRQLMSVIQSLKTNDLHDDSSFDFFDMDTTFSDRFFSDTTTTSEKSIC